MSEKYRFFRYLIEDAEKAGVSVPPWVQMKNLGFKEGASVRNGDEWLFIVLGEGGTPTDYVQEYHPE